MSNDKYKISNSTKYISPLEIESNVYFGVKEPWGSLYVRYDLDFMFECDVWLKKWCMFIKI